MLILFFILSIIPCNTSAFDDPHTVFMEIGPQDDLVSTVSAAASGTTILLDDGTYGIGQTLNFRTDDVTIRSKSGDREAVVLDGNQGGLPLLSENFINEVVAVGASRVSIADLTIRYARHHPIHVYPPADRPISNCVMSNIHVHDGGQQLIKVNSNGGDPLYWADSGVVENSLIEFIDNSVMEYWPDDGIYYTGGLDVHGGCGWIIRNNVFRNIQRNATMMEHAVHMWSKCRGTLIENNRFEDCYRAVGLGMKTASSGRERFYSDGKGDNPYFDHIDGMVRNNMLFNRQGIHMESGIEIMNVIDAEIYHNTVVSVDQSFSGIEYRWPNTSISLKNNLCSHNIRPRDGASADAEANIENAAAGMFVDYDNGDLHLVSSASDAIDCGVPLGPGRSDVDFDGDVRDASPDVGADEWSANSVGPEAGNLKVYERVEAAVLPERGVIRIAISGFESRASARLFNSLGRKIRGSTVLPQASGDIKEVIWRTERIPPGVYILRVSSNRSFFSQAVFVRD